jgi:hypothetical protein
LDDRFDNGFDDRLDEILGFTNGFEDAMVIATTIRYDHNTIRGEEGTDAICSSSFTINFLHSASFLQLRCFMEGEEERGQGGDKMKTAML